MHTFRPSYLFNFYLDSQLEVSDVRLEVGDEIPLEGNELRIGRSAGNDVVLDHPGISRHHATFILKSEDEGFVLVLRDEGSTNGCRVNGRRHRSEECEVTPTDMIMLGPFVARFVETRTNLRDVDTIVNDDSRIELERKPSNDFASLDISLQVLYQFVSTAIDYKPEELVTAAAVAISRCIEFDTLCILLQTHKGLEPAVTWNGDGPCPASKIVISETVLKQSVQKRVGVIAGTKMDPDETSVLRSLRSALCVPLARNKESLGAIYLSSTSILVVYEQQHLETLSLFANTLATNISSTRAFAELRAEKQKLQAILNGLQEGVVVTDAEHNIVSANHAALQIFGDAALLGKSIQRVLTEFCPTFRTDTLPGLTYFQLEESSSQTRSRDVERVFSVTVGSNEVSEQGNRQYVYCFHDTTKHRRMEQSKSVLVNRLTHKLITPLTIVSAANHLAMEHLEVDADSELYEILRESNDTCKSYVELIRRFMRYTQLISTDGFRPQAWSEYPIEELLEEAAAANQTLIDEKKFEIVRLYPRNRMNFWGDREMLSMVFQNVIQNALKFGPPEGTLAINVDPSGDVLKVSFQDNGPGIPPSEVEHLGVLLHQVDPEGTGEVPGAGIGLAIVHEIVQSHGGRVRIESPITDAGGTLVELYLPGSSHGAVPPKDPEQLSESTIRC